MKRVHFPTPGMALSLATKTPTNVPINVWATSLDAETVRQLVARNRDSYHNVYD